MREKFREIRENSKTSLTKNTVDPSIFNDPIASKTSWSHLKEGGWKFATHNLKKIGAGSMEFKAARGPKCIYHALLFFGIGLIFLFLLTILEKGITYLNLDDYFFLLAGTPIAIVGYYIFNLCTRPIVFDKDQEHFWKGKRGPSEVVNIDSIETLVKFDEIYAIQLLSEDCFEDESFNSYELNLILKDAKRINVVDHGKLENIRRDAKMLAEFLEKPLWDAI